MGLVLFGGGPLAVGAGVAFLLVDPVLSLGMIRAAFDLTIGQIYSVVRYGKLAYVEFRGGGSIIHNAASVHIANAFESGELADAVGPFVFAPSGVSASTIQHGLGHVKQYRAFGGWGEVERRIHGFDFEYDADIRAGTNAYGGNPIYNCVAYGAAMRAYEMTGTKGGRLIDYPDGQLSAYMLLGYMSHLY